LRTVVLNWLCLCLIRLWVIISEDNLLDAQHQQRQITELFALPNLNQLFVSKLSITIEETDEACFWMEFIIDEQLLKKEKVVPLLQEGYELTSILVSSRKTARGLRKNRNDNLH
jgi:hypothetical protein